MVSQLLVTICKCSIKLNTDPNFVHGQSVSQSVIHVTIYCLLLCNPLVCVRAEPSFVSYGSGGRWIHGAMILLWEDIKCLFFQEVLEELMTELHGYLLNLHTFLRCLHTLTASLPKSPVGKQVCVQQLHSTALQGKVSSEVQSYYNLVLLLFSWNKL
jgi:cytochrome b561